MRALLVAIAIACACTKTTPSVAPSPPPATAPPTDEQACAHRDHLVAAWFDAHAPSVGFVADADCVRRLKRIGEHDAAAHDCILHCDALAEKLEVDDACRKRCPPLPPWASLRRLDDPDEGPPPGGPNDPSTVIARNRWRFKACYNDAIAIDARAGGMVRVAVALDASGAASASIESTDAKPPSLAECVAHAFRLMQFSAPAPGDQTSFTVPVRLSNSD